MSDNFEEAFNALNSLECESESCEITDNSVVVGVAGTYQEEMMNHIMRPARSGFYLSRLDIKKLAATVDESIQIDERRRMMEQFLRVVDSKESFENIANNLKNAIDAKVAIYTELSTLYPKCSEFFEPYIALSNNSKALLDRIVSEF